MSIYLSDICVFLLREQAAAIVLFPIWGIQSFSYHLPDQMARSLATTHLLVKNVTKNGSRGDLHCYYHGEELGLLKCWHLIVKR